MRPVEVSRRVTGTDPCDGTSAAVSNMPSKVTPRTDKTGPGSWHRVRDEVGRCARAWSRRWSECEQHLEEPGQVEPADLADLEALRARLYQDRALGATSAG